MGHGDISPGKAYILSLVYNLALEKRGSICYNYGVAVCPFSQTRKGDNQWERISKGKTAVRGICQRKDGLYYARFVDKAGKRHDKYFQTLPEARNWIEEAKYADKHEDVFAATETTVDEWFNFWIENIVGDLAPNTLRNYRERYVHNIQPVMGSMMIANVKPMHCKFKLVPTMQVLPSVRHTLRWVQCSRPRR